MNSEETKIQLYNPYPWQRAVHQGIDNSEVGTIHIVLARRQIGKSQIIVNEMLRHQSGASGYSLCVEPSFRQAKKIYKDVLRIVDGTPLLVSSSESELKITIIGGGVMQFCSAGSADRLRGSTISRGGILCVDEAAFISDNCFYGILLPMTNVNRSDILIVSTPMFQSGFFYKFFTEGRQGRKGVKSYDLNQYDTSALLSNDKLEEYRAMLPKRQFLTEYLGQFVTTDSEVFGNFDNLCSNNINQNNKQYYYGIDWATGSNNDRTAICVFNSDRQMVLLDYFNDRDASGTINNIAQLAKQYPPIGIAVEQNSIGVVFYELLRKALPNIRVTKFNTSNDSKNAIVNKMQVAIQNNAVQFLDNMDFKLEMSNFISKTTPSGKVTYAADGNGHDDLVMATLIAFNSLNKTHYILV